MFVRSGVATSRRHIIGRDCVPRVGRRPRPAASSCCAMVVKRNRQAAGCSIRFLSNDSKTQAADEASTKKDTSPSSSENDKILERDPNDLDELPPVPETAEEIEKLSKEYDIPMGDESVLYQDIEITGTLPKYGIGVEVGQFAEMERMFKQRDVDRFGMLIADPNPIHSDQTAIDDLPHVLKVEPREEKNDEDGRKANMRAIHGIFVATMFSSIFGNLMPGAIYLKQTLNYIQPVFTDQRVVARVEICRIHRRRGLILSCNSTVRSAYSDGTVKVRGEAKVWLPDKEARKINIEKT